MEPKIEARPLDALNDSRGKQVMVELKNGKQFVGKLVAFDIHINTVLEEAQELEKGEVKRNIGKVFIRGDTIVLISPSA
jgi:small nuclear ribonucleoprotein